MKSFQIEDDISKPAEGAVEVVMTMDDDSQRWCFFMTPDRLAQVGDYVPGTNVRLHYGASHMIVTSELNAEIIEKVLRYLDSVGELENCSREEKVPS